MKKLLIGSANKAKVSVYKKLLKDFDLEVVSAKDLDIIEPEETGKTFEQTALDKAKHYFEKSQIPTIADDGGLEIEALNGEPGVKSNRWIGRKMSDEEIIAEVIKRMEDIPEDKRTAKHTVVVALATPFGIFTSDAELAGVVAKQAHKKRMPGFPYRSVLFFPNYNKYWVELTDEEEEILNHSKAALEKIHDIIKELEK